MHNIRCSKSVSIANNLEEVDWSFSQRAPNRSLEAIHPYPAKFIGEIPRSFLQVLPIPSGTVVLDPFCGSGTTLLESQKMGIPSIGIDLNPIACLISRVKTGPHPVDLKDVAQNVVEQAKAIKDPDRWEIPNVSHWFKPEIQNTIATLLAAITDFAPRHCADALRLALSSIIVRVSNQESDTRYAAINKDVSPANVYSLFISAIERINNALLSRNWELADVKIIENDILKVKASDVDVPVGMVITSPPYPNAYEYWLYHKYRMWWLKYDPLAVKAQEIGARAHFFKKNPHTEDHFRQQMLGTFNLLYEIVVPSGFICFVIGRSKIKGTLVDNADIIKKVAFGYGLRLITCFDREIASTSKSFNLSHANIKTESLLVFQK